VKNYLIDRSEFIQSEHWSLSNALHMMKLSYAAYAGTTDDIGSKEAWSITENLVHRAGYKMKKIEARHGIYEPNAMVCWDDDNVFLIFRGTEPTAWNQWATDGDVIRQPFKIGEFQIGEIHTGFLTSVETIWNQIKQCLHRANPQQDKKLFVGGHSLGAGMSQAASSILVFSNDLPSPTAVYNFGCPRALDAEAANRYNEQLGPKTYRVVNNNDIVCDVPLEVMGFSHVGQLKYLASNGELLDEPSSAKMVLDGWLGGLRELTHLNPADFITDHLPHNYTRWLSDACEHER